MHIDARKVMTVLVAGMLAACAQQSEVGSTIEMGDAGDAPAEAVETATPDLPTWQAIVTNTEVSSVKGEVALRDVTGPGTFVSIAVEGADPSAAMPWHVHRGDCGSGGAIVGDAATYPLLIADADGEAEAEAEIAVDLDLEADYHVNVHRSVDEIGTIVACGQVTRQ